jgi:hypothetical protein
MKLVKKLIVLTMMTALIIILFGLIQQNNRDEIMLYTQPPQQRQLRSKFDSRYADPKTVTIKQQSHQQTQTQKIINLDTIFSIANHNIIDDNKSQPTTFDPASYAYLIIHYHKTGHHLSRQLRLAYVTLPLTMHLVDLNDVNVYNKTMVSWTPWMHLQFDIMMYIYHVDHQSRYIS